MATFDAVLGGSQDVFNTVIAQLHPVLYKSGLLTQKVHVGQLDIDSATFDIVAPFTVDFKSSPPEHLLQHYREAMDIYPTLREIPADKRQTALASLEKTLTKVAFIMKVPKINFVLNYVQSPGSPKPPTTIPNASIDIGAVVSIEAQNDPATILVQAASAAVHTGDPILDDVLEKGVMPFVLNLLNTKILTPQNIPTLSFEGITISPPSITADNGFLLVSTALGSTSPSTSATSGWPTDGVFVSVDTNLIGTVANMGISKIGWIGKSFDASPFTGNAGVNLGGLSNLSVNQDGALSISIPLNASAGITWHTPNSLPNFSLGASTDGSVSATLAAAVAGGKLVVTIRSLDDVHFNNFSFDLAGIPLPVPGLDALSDVLINLLRPAVSSALSGLSFTVYSIPVITIPVGPGITITLPTVATQGLNESGKSLLVAHGMPIIS